MLAQHGLPRLAVLDVKEDPVAQRAQEIGRLEEGLDGEPIAFLRLLLPARHESARDVPGDAVPVVQQVGDVEELRQSHQFRRFLLIAPQLGEAPLDGVTVLGVFMLDDGYRQAVDHEHHVRTVALARRRFELPFPGDVKEVGPRTLKIDDLDGPLTLLGLVVPLPLPAQPGKHLSVALNGWRERFESFDDGAEGAARHPGVEPAQGAFEFALKQQPGFAATLLPCSLRRDRRPANSLRVTNHRELHRAGFSNVKGGHKRLPARQFLLLAISLAN